MTTIAATMTGGGSFLFLYVIVFAVIITAEWKVFVKAGHAGWKAIIPVYSAYIVCKIVGRPGWWLILFFIPFVNIFVLLVIALDMAKSFGRGTGFGIGLWILSIIFIPILGFGPAQYVGPQGIARA